MEDDLRHLPYVLCYRCKNKAQTKYEKVAGGYRRTCSECGDARIPYFVSDEEYPVVLGREHRLANRNGQRFFEAYCKADEATSKPSPTTPAQRPPHKARTPTATAQPSASNSMSTSPKQQPDADTARFLNFPVCMLAGTIDDPLEMLCEIYNYALMTEANSYKLEMNHALARLAYQLMRDESPILSTPVQEIAKMESIQRLRDEAEFAIHNPMEGCEGESCKKGFQEQMDVAIAINRPSLTKKQEEDLLTWARLDKATQFFKLPLSQLGFDRITKRHPLLIERIQAQTQYFKGANKSDAEARAPVKFFLDTFFAVKRLSHTATPVQDNAKIKKILRLFRMVCAIRGMVGTASYYSTVKKAIAARCVGAKTAEVAALMAAQNPKICEELHALRPDGKTFGTIIELGASRGFYTCLGVREHRCIYLSIKARTQEQLASWVVQKRSKKNADAEAARKIILGLKPPLPPSEVSINGRG